MLKLSCWDWVQPISCFSCLELKILEITSKICLVISQNYSVLFSETIIFRWQEEAAIFFNMHTRSVPNIALTKPSLIVRLKYWWTPIVLRPSINVMNWWFIIDRSHRLTFFGEKILFSKIRLKRYETNFYVPWEMYLG